MEFPELQKGSFGGQPIDAEPVTGGEMKALDRHAIEVMGMSSLVLMERAALAAVEALFEQEFDLRRVLCVCGAGNNGGDGFAAARLLRLRSVPVRALFVGSIEKMTEDTARQRTIAENYGVEIADNDLTLFTQGAAYTTIVDALFGIGGDRPLTGIYLDAVQQINRSRSEGLTKILSLDIPSGVSADTGAILGEAVRADVTVTFAFNKIGLTVEPGKTCAGKTVVRDIGIYRR
ncbi:MAG: NAD(P)H-hydrate epimerase [Synergistaceae bacterium]|jgi:NAD(P)H-hydrate epimerase|nr:NAD(P)H-hydrate epimerase [Synergistaceae bacterium]